MKNNVIALILVIPLLLLFTIQSTVSSITLAVDVPVSGVEVRNENTTVELTENPVVQIEAEVSPADASDKTLSYRAEAVEGLPQAEVVIDAEGRVTPRSAGTVRLVAQAGEGLSDSFVLTVLCSKVTGFSALKESLVLYAGESMTLTEGEEFSVTPADTEREIDWRSSDPETLSVNALTGRLTANRRGSAVLTGTIPAEYAVARTEEGFEPAELTVTIAVEVLGYADRGNGILFGDSETASVSVLGSGTTVFDLTEENLPAGVSAEDLDCQAEDPGFFASVTLDVRGGRISYTLSPEAGFGQSCALEIGFWEGEAFTALATLTVTKGAELPEGLAVGSDAGSGTVVLRQGSSVRVALTDELPEGVEVRLTSSDAAKASVADRLSGGWTLSALAEGTIELRAELLYGEELLGSLTRSVEIVNPYDSLTLSRDSGLLPAGFGQECVLAVSRFDEDGSLTEDSFVLSLTARRMVNGLETEAAVEAGRIEYLSSDPQVAVIDDGGRITVKGAGTVTLSASCLASRKLGRTVSASVTLTCVEGVNVYTEDDLRLASEQALPAALRNSIRLGAYVDPDGSAAEVNAAMEKAVSFMTTTADYTYYANAGVTDPRIKYIIRFTADVYGNGYELNAHRITTLQGSDYDFSGPLDLVRFNYMSASYSVKEQDNVCFLVEAEQPITLTNLTLKGRDDVSDLTLLDHTGTVLECLTDCTLSYSTVKNGRTGVRVFGGTYADPEAVLADPDSYRVNVEIFKSVISYAREFGLKIGCNQTLKLDPFEGVFNGYEEALRGVAAPQLTDFEGNPYDPDAGKDGTFGYDAYFEQTYLLTEVRLADSVLSTAGFFTVGIQSKFGGPALYYGKYNQIDLLDWENVGGTSFASRLTLAGEVQLRDWKKISSIDSSTLIEITPDDVADPLIRFDIKEILNSSAVYDAFVDTVDGEEYVHGGIACYGGGYNYCSVVYESGENAFSAEPYLSLEADLQTIGIDRINALLAAAGNRPFFFLMYGRDSAFSYREQLATESTAYDGLYRTPLS